MKRMPIGFSLLVLSLALSLASCDAMFTTNIFSGLTHSAQTVASIKAMSTGDLATYIESAANLQALAKDDSLKQAALTNLETTYTSNGDPSERQLAAETAATISIKTVSSAAQFSGSLLGAASGTGLSTESDVLSVIKTALGGDTLSGLSSSSSPSSTFTAIINAFLEANDAYVALGASVQSSGYADSSTTSSEKNEIAVNAAIAALVSSVAPVSGDLSDEAKAQALWSALADPGHSSSYIKPTSLNYTTLTASGTPLAALISNSSLNSLLLGGK